MADTSNMEIDKNRSFDKYLLNMVNSEESGDKFNKVKIKTLLNEAYKYNIKSRKHITKLKRQGIINKFNILYNSIKDLPIEYQLNIISCTLLYQVEINDLSTDQSFLTRLKRRNLQIELIEALNLSIN